MERESKKIVISVIIGFCLISMLVAFFNFMIVFRLKDVSGSNMIWYLSNTWELIPILICCIAIITILCIISLKDFFCKNRINNKTKFVLLIVTITLTIIVVIFTTLFLESMFYGSNPQRIGTEKLTAYVQTFSSLFSFLIPATVITTLLTIPVIKEMIKIKKEKQIVNIQVDKL